MSESKSRNKTARRPPRFRTEDEERAFWSKHDSTDYVGWKNAVRAALPNLKPSTETISLRLPAALLAELKALANKRDVPYQSLLKVFLAERIAGEGTILWVLREDRRETEHQLLQATSQESLSWQLKYRF